MNNIVSSFIDSVIEQKKLQFTNKEVEFNDFLFESKLIKLENEKIVISNYEYFATCFLKKYKIKIDFKINDDFAKTLEFLNKIKEDFNDNSFVQGYHILEKEIWNSLIKESNLVYDCTFNDYLNSINLDNMPKGIFNFAEAYSKVLPDLNLSENIIYDNALILMDLTKSDAQFNVNLGNVLNGIKNVCKADYSKGIELFNNSLQVIEEKEGIISAIVSGLYENKKIEFFDLILDDLFKEGKRLNPIFFGLSNISKIENPECVLFVKLIEEWSKKDSYLISTLSLVFSILKSDNFVHNKYCFKVLESVIENEKTTYYILNNLRWLDNFNKEKTEVIIRLTCQSYFSIDKHISSISNVFLHIDDVESFKLVVLSVIENKPCEKFMKSFKSFFHSVDKSDLDKFTIELLTDNLACMRNTGVDIFKQLSSYSPYCFSFNILELEPISQYKLWVTLTQDFHNPKNRLSSLLPLLNSDSELIKESFISKLEEISEDYGRDIVLLLEEYPEYILETERIKGYIKEYNQKYIDLKKSVLELNPYHAQYKYVKSFNELFSKNMSESIDLNTRENSLLSILGTNTVKLSKGGGWRIGANSEVSKLGKVGASLTMPRSYFIDPNKYEIEKGFLMKQNWTDQEFLDIKIFLENE